MIIRRKVVTLHPDSTKCDMQQELIIGNTMEVYRLLADDIFLFKADNNYCDVVYTNGEEEKLHFKLGYIEAEIERQMKQHERCFLRLGRSLIINQRYLHNVNVGKQSFTLRAGNGKMHKEANFTQKLLVNLKQMIESKLMEKINNDGTNQEQTAGNG